MNYEILERNKKLELENARLIRRDERYDVLLKALIKLYDASIDFDEAWTEFREELDSIVSEQVK